MHGQYIRNIDRQLISEEDAFLWLSKGELKAETEREQPYWALHTYFGKY